MSGARRLGRLPAGAIAALGFAVLFGLWRTLIGDPVTEALERRLLDIRFQLRGPWDGVDAAAVVAVDERTLQARGGPSALRAALAEAVPRILEQEPKALAIDLLLVDEMPADPQLAASLAGDPRVLLAVAALNGRSGAGPPGPELTAALDRSAFRVVVGGARGAEQAVELLLPTPGLAGAARLAHVNILRDPDRVAREAPLALRAPGGRIIPSMALAAAATAEGAELRLIHGREARMGMRSIPLGPDDAVVMDHPGPPEEIETVSLADVLEGRTPPDAFRGRLVFVGATAESLRDVFVTPFGADVPGVKVLAGLGAALMEGRVIRRDGATRSASVALALALCGGALAAAAISGNARALAAGGAVVALGLAAAQGAFALGGWWLDGVTLLAGAGAGALAGAEGRYSRSRRERTNLARFVAPALAERLAREGPAGIARRMQPAAVVFCDVAGFTTLSERASPEQTADFLAALHALFEAEAERRGGVVVDYQGDGAMIVFGLPDPAPDDAARALACVDALAEGAAGLAPHAPAGAAVRLRSSVHQGPVALAVLGGPHQAVVTVAGDTVNLASRLQELAKAHGADIVASREALEAAGLLGRGAAEAAGYRFLARAPVRGRSAEAEVWARATPTTARGPVGALGG